MRLLLDENLPKRLKQDFTEHEIYIVHDKEWNGVKNGELLKLLVGNSFDALLTYDKNLQHQQNFSKYTIAVFVLTAKNRSVFGIDKINTEDKRVFKQRTNANRAYCYLR